MPAWPDWFAANDRRGRGAEQARAGSAATPVINEKHGTASRTNSTGPTVVEDVLPPPATHSSPSSSTHRRWLPRFLALDTLNAQWVNFKKHIVSDTVPSNAILEPTDSSFEDDDLHDMEDTKDENDAVDEVVVDRSWGDEIKSSTTFSDHAASPEKSSAATPHIHLLYETESLEIDKWNFWTIFTILRFHTWPFFLKVFSSRFADEKAEARYAQENWSLKKPLALWAALWLICNWVLGCIFIPHNPIAALDKVFYFGVAPILSFPVLFMVIYDWPRDHSYLYQLLTVFATWCWPFYQIIFILSCGFYTRNPNSCGTRDFMATFYYQTALQAIALFGLKLNRFPAALGAIVFLLFASVSIIPSRSQWGRSMINFFIFHSFLIYVHYMREASERRLFSLRDQLTRQIKETRRAQQNERKAADSKRRLTSYVRVPLNTAMLAVHNISASGIIQQEMSLEFTALNGSLSMMSKVLNDVLDFNRMDSGNFESMSRPYCFHQVLRSLFVPLRLATESRELHFEADLDPNIDLVARLAAYKAMDEDPEAIKTHIRENPNVDGIVTGDETRLRQIITNLASNACKFTPKGGKLSIRTRLVRPSITGADGFLEQELPKTTDGQTTSESNPLSVNHLDECDSDNKRLMAETIVVRIEVTDTGYGIRKKDMTRSKLFSAFNQTEQGRQQGGKGTGLGLALVRQIVRLSNGRLGVRSKPGEGSTFWVELPLGVGSKTMNVHGPELPDASKPPELGPLHPEPTMNPDSTPSKHTRGSQKGAAEHFPQPTPSGSGAGSSKTTALRELMEQVGPVALILRNKDFDVTPPAADVIDPLHNLALMSSESSPDDADVTSPRSHLSRHSVHSVSSTSPMGFGHGPNRRSTEGDRHGKSKEVVVPSTGPAHTSRPSGSGPQQHQRPTYVELPSHKFSIEEALHAPPTTGSISSSSHSHSTGLASTTNLTLFDHAFSRGSPAASLNKLNIEPNLPVLVVDDDAWTRALMKKLLTRLGCHVVCAENGEVALEILLGLRGATSGSVAGSTPSSDISRDSRPILERPTGSAAADVPSASLPSDQRQQQHFPPSSYPPALASADSTASAPSERRFAVVFLDNQMPVMSGLKVVERLRELGRTDFVVGVTGNALLSDQEEYLAAGVDSVLTKPVQERSLRDALVQAYEKYRSRLDSDPAPLPSPPS